MPKAPVLEILKNKPLFVQFFLDKTKLQSDHFEGYSQTKISRMKGLSRDEKDDLLLNAKNVIPLAFMDELKNRVSKLFSIKMLKSRI